MTSCSIAYIEVFTCNHAIMDHSCYSEPKVACLFSRMCTTHNSSLFFFFLHSTRAKSPIDEYEYTNKLFHFLAPSFARKQAVPVTRGGGVERKKETKREKKKKERALEVPVPPFSNQLLRSEALSASSIHTVQYKYIMRSRR